VTSASRSDTDSGSIERAQTNAMRLAVGSALLTFALAFYVRSLDLLRTDVPLRASDGRFFWVVTIVAVMAFGFVAQYVSTNEVPSGAVDRARTATVASNGASLPALVVFAAVQFAAWDSRLVVVFAAPLLAGAGVFTAVVVRYYLLSGDDAVLPGARLVHLALTTGVAFLSLSLARGWMGGPGYTLVVIAILSSLLLYQGFDGVRAFPIRRVAYALVGGVVVAESAMALSYWPPSGWFGGAFVTTVFVVILLTIEAILSRRITTDVAARYLGAGVGVCGLLIVLAR
jgi:hypothetical protein